MVIRVALSTAAALVALGCGPGKGTERIDPDPPWVADYQRIAREGCECIDPECLDLAHTAAEAMVAKHGGLDEVPPSVHVAHGELDACWRDGTEDLGRDLTDAADAVCTCTKTACIDAYRLQVLHLGDKYRVDLTGAAATLPDAARAPMTRANACVEAVTISADEFLAAMKTRTAAVCKCEALDCVRSTPLASFGDRFYMPDRPSIEAELKDTTEEFCACISQIIAKAIRDKVIPEAAGVSMSVRLQCPE
jgi:hypothetical protein